MQITITKAMLEERDACKDGIEAFVKMFGESGTVDWTRDKQIELLKSPLGKFIVWAWSNDLLPLWNLSGANLSRANLSGANLYGANLYGADLSGAIPNTLYAEMFASFGWAIVDGRLQKAKHPVEA